ncbi:hypothetical protein CDL15_Pgr004046 [Punica granatum]|uniref:Uncharacterized protein n=1 Tax=Punica granatum TaxID=22663 RepID=A0A218XF85_PUNGR|nr:hypothetical protein CDL15_Pgr004046 [Punica granatum]
MRGQNPKAGPKPDAVNAAPEPDVGPEPNAVNAYSIRKCKRCKSKVAQYSGCLLVENFLQWEKKTMKEHKLFKISMQECREANWPECNTNFEKIVLSRSSNVPEVQATVTRRHGKHRFQVRAW